MNRHERRAAKHQGLVTPVKSRPNRIWTGLPRKLSANPSSPYFDPEACSRVDKVFVDGVYLPDCMGYDMDEGWAFNRVDGVWKPKVFGAVTVMEKPQ